MTCFQNILEFQVPPLLNKFFGNTLSSVVRGELKSFLSQQFFFFMLECFLFSLSNYHHIQKEKLFKDYQCKKSGQWATFHFSMAYYITYLQALNSVVNSSYCGVCYCCKEMLVFDVVFPIRCEAFKVLRKFKIAFFILSQRPLSHNRVNICSVGSDANDLRSSSLQILFQFGRVKYDLKSQSLNSISQTIFQQLL